jgi:two-component system, NtrC family, response regulator AtoC
MPIERETPTTRVLVVDDEEMIRWSIEQTLSKAGYEVVGAGTGAEGMALFRQLHPAVVFLDIRLPDVNGITVLKHINEGTGTAPAVIMMTAFEEDCSATEVARLGACRYLRKPFNFDELEKLVRQALYRRR